MGKERQLCMMQRACNMIESFKRKWRLQDLDTSQKLKALNHKCLRYVIDNYDGTTSLEDVIETGKEYVPENPDKTEWTSGEDVGLVTISRFSRLELIDPIADAAVFGDANL